MSAPRVTCRTTWRRSPSSACSPCSAATPATTSSARSESYRRPICHQRRRPLLALRRRSPCPILYNQWSATAPRRWLRSAGSCRAGAPRRETWCSRRDAPRTRAPPTRAPPPRRLTCPPPRGQFSKRRPPRRRRCRAPLWKPRVRLKGWVCFVPNSYKFLCSDNVNYFVTTNRYFKH